MLRRFLVLFLHAAVFVGLLWCGWRRWPDPIVDFGRELYVPWQITQGKVLYRDIASLFGPLSPYLNALWMRLFGVSLMTIAWCNIAIFTVTLALIHRLIRQCTDRYTAACATLMALALCGLAQYVDTGNYNFVTPYSHEATHGFALSVLTLVIVQHALRTRRPAFGAAAGLTFGLSLLTKPELPIAVASALCLGFIAFAMVDPSARRLLALTSLWLVVASAVAPTLFFVYFRQQLGTVAAVKAIAAGWIAASNSAVTSNVFYVVGMGADAPLRNALLLCAMFLLIISFVAALFVLSQAAGSRRPVSGALMHIASIGLVGVAPIGYALPLGRALPLGALAAVLISAAALWKDRGNSERVMRLIGLLIWATFALVLLGKIGLFPRISHYGFYLALPAVTIAVVLICWVVPEYAHLWDGRGIHRDFRVLVAILLAASAFPYLTRSYEAYKTKTIPIGAGADRFYSSSYNGVPEDQLVGDAFDELKRRVKPGDTLAVLPEGVMLNYLLRNESPLRVVTMMPPEILTFGEAAIVRSLEAAPPDLIVYVHKRTSEYGYPLFGTSPLYGQITLEWIHKRYRLARTLGKDPQTPSGLGFEIFEKM